ncbi:MAG: hypothetical protein M1813_004205 [Trichoglossum hirsutum]|nr:MAG: hypothetical protein M1813_004205 [Trichoglossum hirsutum]
MEIPQLQPQPDFAVISQSLRQLSDQVILVENTPAFGDAARILQELRDGFRAVNERLDRMDDHQNRMDNHQKAEAVNSIARLQNSRVNRPDQSLAVLHSYSSNTPIPNFPETPEVLTGFSRGADINPILRGLDLSVGGNLDERKQRLRLAIGLHQRAV